MNVVRASAIISAAPMPWPETSPIKLSTADSPFAKYPK